LLWQSDGFYKALGEFDTSELDVIPGSTVRITTPYAATENCLRYMSIRHFQGRDKYLSELLLVARQCSVEPSHQLQFLCGWHGEKPLIKAVDF